jgi:hypothetical protein
MDLTLDTVSSLLHDVTTRSGAHDQAPEAALGTVSTLAQPGLLADLLRSLRAHPGAVATCAAKSYRHPLGFERIALIDAEPEFMLRAHVWWPRNGAGPGHVHNHRFGFASAVVRGGYDMQLFHRDQAGMPMIEYREQSAGGVGIAAWHLDALRPARLRLLSGASLQQGSGYALAANALHRVTVRPGTLCVTLFLETAVVRPVTQVFAEPGTQVRAATREHVLTSDNYRRRLDAVLDALAG